MDFRGHWEQHLDLAEFTYNNIYNSSIEMTSFEALYGRRYRYLVGLFETFEVRTCTDLLQESLDRVGVIQAWLRAAHIR